MGQVAEFEDRLQAVCEPVFERQTVVEVRLQPKEVEAVKQIAKAKGVVYGDLIRQWVLEKVAEEGTL